MIDVTLLSVIRRWHHRDGIAIREIARRTGLSRNTVRKYLASGVDRPEYAPLAGGNNYVLYWQAKTYLGKWFHFF